MNYKEKAIMDRRRRINRLLEKTVCITVLIIMIFALKQGNLRKTADAASQDESQGTSAAAENASQLLAEGSSVQLKSVVVTEQAEGVSTEASEDEAAQDGISGDEASKGTFLEDYYNPDIYVPAEVVDDSYFSTALLVGDSRAETLGLYSDLESFDVYASKDLNISTVATSKVAADAMGNKKTVAELLEVKHYDSIYLCFGLEELNWYNKEFVTKYKAFLDSIEGANPDITVYVMSVIPVSAELSASDTVYNNPAIDKMNALLRDMCRSYENVIYLDVASSVSSDGVLPEEAGSDGKHLDKEHCQMIMDYIRKNVYVRR
jgi:hypothetical protein